MGTGPGAADAQGIWQYGEDDTETLMSDLLNVGQQSISDALVLDRGRLDSLERRAQGTGVRVFTAAASGTFDIIFPVGLFTAAPTIVSVICASASLGCYFSTGTPTQDKVTVQGFNGAAALSVPYRWFAVQP